MSLSAQAIVFPAAHQIEIRQHPVPDLRADEVLLRSICSGVSQGTEIWALNGQRPELSFPTVPGYQTVGIIEALGESVESASKYFIGQRVLIRGSRLPDSFPPTWMGAHVSHAVVAAMSADAALGSNVPVPVPDGVDSAAACLAALPAVSLRGLEMLRIEIGDVVVVMGQGLIGQSSAQLARLRGATVVVCDINPIRLQQARKTGADVVVDARSEDLGEVVRALQPRGADVVIEATGRASAFADCIDLLRWEGQLLLQAWYPDPISFDFHQTHGKKPTIAITCGYDESNLAQVLDLLKWGKLDLSSLLTHRVPFEQAPALYRRMAANDSEIGGVVFDWSH